MDKKITVVGAGYTGLSNAVLLSQKNDVTVLDIDVTRVKCINDRKCPFKDKDIENFLHSENLDITATTDKNEAYQNAKLLLPPRLITTQKKIISTLRHKAATSKLQRRTWAAN